MPHTAIPLPESFWRGYPISVVRVLDADTIDVVIDLGLQVQKKERLRIMDIDAPEIRGEEKPEGMIARRAVILWVAEATDLWISTRGEGKYGRLLAYVYNQDGEELSDMLLKKGLVKPYE